MTKDPDNKKKSDEMQDDTQKKELMDEQYEFGLNEDVREELEKEDDSHKEPEKKAEADDEVVKDD